MWAACDGHEGLARLLIENEADVFAQENYGWTALHHAARGGHETVARLLLDAGASEQTQTNHGRTPEDLATAHGHHQTAAMFKAEGVRRAQCVAFAMGHHERLGEGSPVQALDAGVVQMVLEQV